MYEAVVKETAKILWMVYIGFTFLQFLLLGFAGMSWFDSICHAFTTMPTGGFSTQNASIAAYSNPVIHYIYSGKYLNSQRIQE